MWIKLTEETFSRHGGFKFMDYFASVGRPETAPIEISAETHPDDIEDDFWEGGIEIDIEALWDACPFRGEPPRP